MARGAWPPGLRSCGSGRYVLRQSHTAVVFLTVSVIAFAVGEFSQTLRLRRGARHSDLLGELVFRILFFGGILMLPLGASLAREALIPGGGIPFVVGAVVGWLGLALRWWSFLTLGRYFTAVLNQPRPGGGAAGPVPGRAAPQLHGTADGILGCGLMLGNWVGLLASLALILVAIIYRLRIEERALTTTLGDAYRRFAATRARLVPFVW